MVVLKNKFHYYFCHNVWYHSKVNKTLFIILIKSSSFVQSCSWGIQAMETSLTFILNDTISCTSLFLLPVIRVSSDHQVVTKCLLFKKVEDLSCQVHICLWYTSIKFLFGDNWFINQWGLVVELASNLHSAIYISTGSPKVWLVLICIFLFFQTFHSEAENAFAPVPPQMV